MQDGFANLVEATVTQAPSPAASGTTMRVSPGAGVELPEVPFTAFIKPHGQQPHAFNTEIVRVTAIDELTQVMTVERQAEGSTQLSITVGMDFYSSVTAGQLRAIVESIEAGGYVLPAGGIPREDLAADVVDDLELGATALRPSDITSKADVSYVDTQNSAQDSTIAAKANDSAVVHRTGNETVAGSKTFTSSPVIPAPSADGHAASKGYVDSAIVSAGGYTDEQAQDAVGSILADSDTVELSYDDAANELSAAVIADGSLVSGNFGVRLENDDDEPGNSKYYGTDDTGMRGYHNLPDTVESVNTQTGTVTLDQDDIGDGATYKQYSQTEKTKLAGVASGATANDSDANLRNRANHTGTQTASTISNFTAAAAAAAPVQSVAGKTGSVTLVKADIGLGNVDNTSDSAKNSAAATLTNKRVTPRAGTATSSATPTINTDAVDFFSLTALATDITGMSVNLSGTPTEGQRLWIAITGTASRSIAWGASFENGATDLPVATSGTQRVDIGLVWNSATSRWRCMAAG